MDLSNFIKKKETLLAIISEAKNWAKGGEKYFTKSLDNFDELRSRLDKDDIYLAILGRQGVGKSTMGNVLLDGKNIFPYDVEETTNILTMVTGISEDYKEYAEVIFEDKNPIKGNLSADFLEPYVSDKEGYNLENQKKVREVRCYAHVGWLEKAGAWLVDTPGVNSLREYNHELTFSFLPHVTVGVFVCSVNPPIQNDEKFFLDTLWEYRPLMYYVQNRHGEPLGDVKEAEEWNLNVFQQLSEKAALNEINSGNKIYTVELGNALNAYNDDDPSEELEESGAKELLDDLSKSLNDKLKTIRLTSSINGLLNIIETRIKGYEGKLKKFENEIVLEKDGIEKDKNKKHDVYKLTKKNILESYNNLLEELKTFHYESLKKLDSKADCAREDLLIQCENSSVSPEYFQKEFEATVKRHFDPPIDTFSLGIILDTFLRRATDELESLSYELGQITQDTIIEGVQKNKVNVEYTTKNNVESEDFMKFLAYTLELAGFFRTGLITYGAVTSMIGAGSIVAGLFAAGTSIATVPVFGWVIAGSSFASAFLLKKYIKKKEKEKLKSAVIKSLNETYLKLRTQVELFSEDISAKTEDVLKEILNKAEELLKDSLISVEALQEPIEKQKQDVAEIKIQIEAGEKLLEKCRGEL